MLKLKVKSEKYGVYGFLFFTKSSEAAQVFFSAKICHSAINRV